MYCLLVGNTMLFIFVAVIRGLMKHLGVDLKNAKNFWTPFKILCSKQHGNVSFFHLYNT